jgi:histone arginine demethylase JMJD6
MWHSQELNPEQFVERYERPRLPVVITGLCDGWRAAKEWTEEGLLHRFGDHKFKVVLPASSPGVPVQEREYCCL